MNELIFRILRQNKNAVCCQFYEFIIIAAKNWKEEVALKNKVF